MKNVMIVLGKKWRLQNIVTAVTLALLALFMSFRAMNAVGGRRSASVDSGDSYLYLPLVFGLRPPSGSYFCNEYEFGLIWTSEVITLNPDGSSIYAYNPPYAGIVTGSWVYTPNLQEIGFTNFRWLTATYDPPDSLRARRYLSEAGFEVALMCTRQQ